MFSTHIFAQEDCDRYHESNTITFTLCSDLKESDNVAALLSILLKLEHSLGNYLENHRMGDRFGKRAVAGSS